MSSADLVNRTVSQIRLCVKRGLTSKALQLMKRHKYVLHVRAYKQIMDTIVFAMDLYGIASHDLISYIFYESPYKDEMDLNTLYAGHEDLFETVCASGAVETVTMLLADVQMNPMGNAECLVVAVTQRRADIVRLLLHSTRITDIPLTYCVNMMLGDACAANQAEIVKLILAEPRLDESIRSKGPDALVSACVDGRISIAKLLLEDARVDPSYKNNAALRAAAKNDKYDIVLILLEHPAVDPYVVGEFFCKNSALVNAACKYGWIDLLKQIALDKKFMAMEMNPTPMALAGMYGQIDVIKLFLSMRNTSKLFDPTYGSFAPLIEACKHGKVDALKLLLAAVESDLPTDRLIFSQLLVVACRSGSLDTVRYLLADSRTDPAVSSVYSSAFLHALQYSHTHIVKLLLEDGRSDIFIDDQVIDHLIIFNHSEIINMVFGDKKYRTQLAKLTAQDYERFIARAAQNSRFEMSRVIKRCRKEMLCAS